MMSLDHFTLRCIRLCVVSLDRGECSEFLSHLNLPTLPISAQESLDAPLTS